MPLHLMNFFLYVELIWLHDLKSLNFSLPSLHFNYCLNFFTDLLFYQLFFYFNQQNFLLFFDSEFLREYYSKDPIYSKRILRQFQHLMFYEIQFHQDYCYLNDLELPLLNLHQLSIL